jgi:hypothetical protein
MSNQEQRPAPSGLGAVVSIVQAVVALVPRWLVVAAGVIFLTWLGFDMYLNARQKLAETRRIEAQSTTATTLTQPLDEIRPALSGETVTERFQRIDAIRAAKGKNSAQEWTLEMAERRQALIDKAKTQELNSAERSELNQMLISVLKKIDEERKSEGK